MTELDDDDLLDALGVEVAPLKTSLHSPREERIIAGFEDILRFHQTHGRAPQHGLERDIFERLYAVRLDQLRKLPEATTLLAAMDSPGFLRGGDGLPTDTTLDEDQLLAQLGVGAAANSDDDITKLRHVRSSSQKREAEEIAEHSPCKDFEVFRPLFERVERDLKAKVRQTLRFGKDASVGLHNFFVVNGQMAYVAEMGEIFKTSTGHDDARLRLVYSNGTESNLLLRSLQKALYRDDAGRRITEIDIGPLFGDSPEPEDLECGTIYVLRSKSTHPYIMQHRELIHKIGVTGDKVETRISAAATDATYLLAEVEVVATYKLHNLHRVKLENLLHRLFGAAQLDLEIADRFGHQVKPREWFLVPLHVIDEAVQRFKDGSITSYHYDIKTACLTKT